MSSPKRLHKVAIVTNALKTLKEAIIPFIVLFVFGGDKGSKWESMELYIILGACLLILIYGLISWWRFTYELTDSELRIEQGVFIRNKRYIRFERIQSVDFSEGIIQQLFGLVKVKIETAGTSGMQAEAVLTAITKQEASMIETAIRDSKKSDKESLFEEEGSEQTEEVVTTLSKFQLSIKELILMGITSGGAGVVFSGAMAFFSQFEEFIPYEMVFKGFEEFIASGVIVVTILVLIGLIIAYIVATAGIVLKYAFFTVVKKEDELVITRGLLERRQITIPLKKIQAIRIVENLVRQPLGYATVYLENAAGSVMDQEASKVMLFPLVKKERIHNLLQEFVPTYQYPNAIKVVPKRSFTNYLFQQWVLWIPVCVAALIFLRPWGYVSILLLPISGVWAYMNYRTAGWFVEHQQLSLRYRTVSKHTFLVLKNRIQSLEKKRSWFQKRKQLSTLSAFIKLGIGPGTGKVVHMDEKDADIIKTWFLPGRIDQGNEMDF
ncbi:PH domain-containing protein [Peribacillus alkalitolerans]|uniref:PH domain-containing protein n=1 Tax=Peribacillus alkalitolerans TaxID=1550385 RepID=UPI0013D7473B|nr:PH domain-containing protein [Peribacillus alkalitolerans]